MANSAIPPGRYELHSEPTRGRWPLLWISRLAVAFATLSLLGAGLLAISPDEDMGRGIAFIWLFFAGFAALLAVCTKYAYRKWPYTQDTLIRTDKPASVIPLTKPDPESIPFGWAWMYKSPKLRSGKEHWVMAISTGLLVGLVLFASKQISDSPWIPFGFLFVFLPVYNFAFNGWIKWGRQMSPVKPRMQ